MTGPAAEPVGKPATNRRAGQRGAVARPGRSAAAAAARSHPHRQPAHPVDRRGGPGGPPGRAGAGGRRPPRRDPPPQLPLGRRVGRPDRGRPARAGRPHGPADGIRVARLPLPGLRFSTGHFSLQGWVDDVSAAVEYLATTQHPKGIWLCGFGTGGRGGLVAAADDRTGDRDGHGRLAGRFRRLGRQPQPADGPRPPGGGHPQRRVPARSRASGGPSCGASGRWKRPSGSPSGRCW